MRLRASFGSAKRAPEAGELPPSFPIRDIKVNCPVIKTSATLLFLWCVASYAHHRNSEAFARGYIMERVHYIVEREHLRDMLECAFVAGTSSQREVYDKKPER